MEFIKRFFKDEEGMGTVEMVVIIALLLGVALLFRKQIIRFVTSILDNIFTNSETNDLVNDPLNTTP